MRGKIKTARRKADKLHGATATYVSLVDAGANETPFTLIKSKQGTKAMAIKKRGKAQKSHKPLTSKRKANGGAAAPTETLIAKMVIDGDKFETEVEVLSYAEQAEWEAEAFSVTKNDDGDWEIRAEGVSDDDFIELAKIDLDDDEDGDVEGVEVFIGKREIASKDDDDEDDAEGEEVDGDDADTEAKSDDDEDDEDEDAEVTEEEKGKGKKKPYMKRSRSTKADDTPKTKVSKRAAFVNARKEARTTTAKFDAWDARFSKGNTLAKTLKDGMEWDGLPPGFYDVQAAFNAAIGNIVAEEGLGDGKQEALNKVAMDYAEVVGGLDTFFDAYIEADEEVVAKAFSDDGQREAVAKWAAEYGDYLADPEAATTVQKQTVAKSDNENSDVGSLVADAVKKSLAPVIEQVEDVSATVQSIAKRSQTKKAADTEDGGAAGSRTVATKGDVEDLDTWRRETHKKGIFG